MQKSAQKGVKDGKNKLKVTGESRCVGEKALRRRLEGVWLAKEDVFHKERQTTRLRRGIQKCLEIFKSAKRRLTILIVDMAGKEQYQSRSWTAGSNRKTQT